MTACASGPSAPSPSDLPFREGTYLVQFVGAELVGSGAGPAVAGCTGMSAAGLRSVTTEITLSRDSGAWRGRSRLPSGGSVDLRLAPGPLEPGGPGGGPGVAGTVTGSAISTNGVFSTDPVPDSRVIFGGAAGVPVVLTGGMSRDGIVAGGRVSGQVAFANSTGALVPCASGTVTWILSRMGL